MMLILCILLLISTFDLTMHFCFSLESDPVYRAQLERLAAASLSSISQPQASLMSPFSLLPRPPGHLVTSLHPRSSEAGQPEPQNRFPTSGSSSKSAKQSGNANAPPSLVPGWEGPLSSVSNLKTGSTLPVLFRTTEPVFHHCTLVQGGFVILVILPDNNSTLLNIININVLF